MQKKHPKLGMEVHCVHIELFQVSFIVLSKPFPNLKVTHKAKFLAPSLNSGKHVLTLLKNKPSQNNSKKKKKKKVNPSPKTDY